MPRPAALFLKKDQGNGIGDRGQSLPASVAHPRWTTHSAPSHWPTGSRGPCARAHRGRSPRGPGGSMPHARSRPRRRRDAGGEASREAATPFSSAPQRGAWIWFLGAYYVQSEKETAGARMAARGARHFVQASPTLCSGQPDTFWAKSARHNGQEVPEFRALFALKVS